MQEATLLSLLNYMEDCAISHSTSAGYGVNELLAADAGWVLYRWLIKIDRLPSSEKQLLFRHGPLPSNASTATGNLSYWTAGITPLSKPHPYGYISILKKENL